MSRERWALVFEPLDDAVPAPVRVRRLLKYALRGLRLKCVNMGGAETQRVEPPAEPQAPARPPPERGF